MHLVVLLDAKPRGLKPLVIGAESASCARLEVIGLCRASRAFQFEAGSSCEHRESLNVYAVSSYREGLAVCATRVLMRRFLLRNASALNVICLRRCLVVLANREQETGRHCCLRLTWQFVRRSTARG